MPSHSDSQEGGGGNGKDDKVVQAQQGAAEEQKKPAAKKETHPNEASSETAAHPSASVKKPPPVASSSVTSKKPEEKLSLFEQDKRNRKRRLNRITAQRKRVRLRSELDHLKDSQDRLTTANKGLGEENDAFRKTITLLRRQQELRRRPGGQQQAERMNPEILLSEQVLMQAMTDRTGEPQPPQFAAVTRASSSAQTGQQQGNLPVPQQQPNGSSTVDLPTAVVSNPTIQAALPAPGNPLLQALAQLQEAQTTQSAQLQPMQQPTTSMQQSVVALLAGTLQPATQQLPVASTTSVLSQVQAQTHQPLSPPQQSRLLTPFLLALEQHQAQQPQSVATNQVTTNHLAASLQQQQPALATAMSILQDQLPGGNNANSSSLFAVNPVAGQAATLTAAFQVLTQQQQLPHPQPQHQPQPVQALQRIQSSLQQLQLAVQGQLQQAQGQMSSQQPQAAQQQLQQTQPDPMAAVLAAFLGTQTSAPEARGATIAIAQSQPALHGAAFNAQQQPQALSNAILQGIAQLANQGILNSSATPAPPPTDNHPKPP